MAFKLANYLQQIDLGNGVAERDGLLFDCMVETPHFGDLIWDRADLVLGSKGAGKSSLFRIFGEHLEVHLRTNHRTIVVTGVETHGEPIFQSYASHFQKFTEPQFESFWKAYLLTLVYNKIFYDQAITPIFASYEAELKSFKTQYESLGLLDVGKITSPTQLLKLSCAFAIAAIESLQAAWDFERNQIIFGINLREKLTEGYKQITVPNLAEMDTILCVDALSILAEKAGYKIWMLLDHLDVVFKRRSPEETRALRALLKVLNAFTSPSLRLKVFLRDDILDAITSSDEEPLAGLSHITARSGQALNWTSDALCILIMKRLANDGWLLTTYGLDTDKLGNVDYARESFQRIFDFKYKRQQAFDWIYSLLEDGRGVVTPRDLIDLLKGAFHIRALWLQKHPDDNAFMSINAIQEAHVALSKNRKSTVLQTEFSHLMHWIRKLENNKDTYAKDELHQLWSSDGSKATAALEAVGVLRFDNKKACYRVAKLYGVGLQVHATRKRKR